MLRTRAPLYSSPCGDFPVRLACVKHAASVRSEPESNSPVIFGVYFLKNDSHPTLSMKVREAHLLSGIEFSLFSFQRANCEKSAVRFGQRSQKLT